MKNYLLYILLFFSISTYSQDTIKTTFIEKKAFKADSVFGIDAFGTTFYSLNNALIKKNKVSTINYSNVQLGKISSANTFNPLKINVFYNAFNTVVILDNRLSEIYKIDFNNLKNYKNVTHVSTGSDNTIWIYNQNLQQLELFNYKNNTVRAKTLPIQSEVLDITSNYNSCWLLTQKYIYQYNYFGSLISKIENRGFTSIKESDENIILKKENTLYFSAKNSEIIQAISIPNLLINQFLVTNEIVYIYSNEMLHQYQLKLK